MRGSSARQLSLLIEPDRRMGDLSDGAIVGTLSLSGKLTVHEDLQPGQGLIVTVARPNGEVIAGATYTVEGVSTVPVKEKGAVFGTERAHGTSIVDADMVRPSDDPHDPRGGA